MDRVAPASPPRADMNAGYFSSPWPAEDGGPARHQTVHGWALGLREGERLACTSRPTLLSTMVVLGAPGEVYLLTHSALRAHLGCPTTASVEQIDPVTLKTLKHSGPLEGGPMWPGGLAVHAHGDLIVVYGRHAHRLNRDCERQCTRRLPEAEPYNSFVVLDNGLVVTKNLSTRHPARLSVMDPVTLQAAAPDEICPEPSVARLSAVGNTVYVVGLHRMFRYHWDEQQGRLQRDLDWDCLYLPAGDEHTHGWDVVLSAGQAWWMDNGLHRYRFRMTGAGVSPTANRLHRMPLDRQQGHTVQTISGLPGGSITNPPLVDPVRRIVIGYDSANGHLQAWRWMEGSQQPVLVPLWHKAPFGCASHMLLFAATGELVINDYRRWREEVVVLDLETGEERARVTVGGWSQGVVFPSPGWDRDIYWSSMSRLARLHVV